MLCSACCIELIDESLSVLANTNNTNTKPETNPRHKSGYITEMGLYDTDLCKIL